MPEPGALEISPKKSSFVSITKASILNKTNQQHINPIVRDMGVSEVLIRQVVHEDIWYFSYKIRKDQFLSRIMKNKKKGHTPKFLIELKYSIHPPQRVSWIYH